MERRCEFHEKSNEVLGQGIEVFDPDGNLKIFCKECKVSTAYGGWSRHVKQHHDENDSQDQVDEGNV